MYKVLYPCRFEILQKALETSIKFNFNAVRVTL